MDRGPAPGRPSESFMKKTLDAADELTLSSGFRRPKVSRERHQNGWVKESGKRVKKWIGHWRPYRPDGTRGHAKVVLGLSRRCANGRRRTKLRAHIREQTNKQARHPTGEPNAAVVLGARLLAVPYLGASDEISGGFGHRAPRPPENSERRSSPRWINSLFSSI